MFIDSAKCHITEQVAAKFSELKINRFLIPPRMTNLLQPADVCWFAHIKNEIHKKWCDWFINSDKKFTRHNNMRSPGYANCIKWISEIWMNFDPVQIRNSFEHCGITSKNNLHSALRHILTTSTINC
jgi:hypothetical protein